MTELARTPLVYRRLFQTVDLAPLPQHRAIVQSLDAWRERRDGEAAPRADEMVQDDTREVSNHSFLLERKPGGAGLAISRVGPVAARAIGRGVAAGELAKVVRPRLAVRVRRLFDLVLERGEPIDVRFSEAGRSFELLAAPLRTDGLVTAAFCAVAMDEPAGGNVVAA
ncbi:MAG: hypothetical protein ACXWUP_13410 [Allosphingosinicella sp.]